MLKTQVFLTPDTNDEMHYCLSVSTILFSSRGAYRFLESILNILDEDNWLKAKRCIFNVLSTAIVLTLQQILHFFNAFLFFLPSTCNILRSKHSVAEDILLIQLGGRLDE